MKPIRVAIVGSYTPYLRDALKRAAEAEKREIEILVKKTASCGRTESVSDQIIEYRGTGENPYPLAEQLMKAVKHLDENKPVQKPKKKKRGKYWERQGF